MRRAFLCLLLLTSATFASFTIAIAPDTLDPGDSATISGTYDKIGDTVNMRIWHDADRNGTLDTALDILLYDTRTEGMAFVDGGGMWDAVADGVYSLRIAQNGGPFEIVGRQFWVGMNNQNTGDTATVYVAPYPASNTSVSGRVTGTGGAMAGIRVRYVAGEGSGRHSNAVFTDASGNYSLNFPDTWQGDTIRINADNELGLYTGTSGLAPRETLIVLTGHSPNVNFVFTAASAAIKVLVVNQDGLPMGGVSVWAKSETAGGQSQATSGTDGRVVLAATPGEWDVQANDNGDSLLVPHLNATIPQAGDTVSLTMRILRTDTAFTGTITDLSGSFDLTRDVRVTAAVDTFGGWYYSDAVIQSNGSLRLPISSRLLPVDIALQIDATAPTGYYADPASYANATPGPTPLTFTIRPFSQWALVTVRDQRDSLVRGVQVAAWRSNTNQSLYTTDSRGIATVPVNAGPWHFAEQGDVFVSQNLDTTLNSSPDTVRLVLRVWQVDGAITGWLSGVPAGALGTQRVQASARSPYSVNPLTVWVERLTDSTFSIPVSSALGLWHVTIADWLVPGGYVAKPGERAPAYPYDSLTVATDSVVFAYVTAPNTLSGRFVGGGPDGTCGGYWVEVVDSLRGVWIRDYLTLGTDSFNIDLPNGVYRISGGYCTQDSSPIRSLTGVVLSNRDTVVYFNMQNGVVGAVPRTLAALVPNARVAGNQLVLSTPREATVIIELFDLRGRMTAPARSVRIQSGITPFVLPRIAATSIVRVTMLGERTRTFVRKVVSQPGR